MLDDTLLVGDLIWLYCEHSPPGYIFCLTSSSVDSYLYSCDSQLRENPMNVPDPQGFTFEIQLRNRYKLQKRYQKLLENRDKHDENDPLYEAQLAESKVAAEAETCDNKLDQRRHIGRPLKYGQIVQLKHSLTNKYIHVSTTHTSPQDKNYMAVHLKPYNAKHAQFKILPRFKVKSEGDLVQVYDQIILESVKSPEQYLHASSSVELDNYTHGCEINLGVDRSGFTIVRYRRPSSEDEKYFPGGSCVRFYHKEIEAYMVAEGRFYNDIESCHLRVDHPKTPSTEGTTFWQVEHQESILSGSPLCWEQQVRIRHMPTRLYLTVNKDCQLCLSTDNIETVNRNPCTVFKLFSVTKEHGRIEHGSYTRIQHVLTGLWLHGEKHLCYNRKHDEKNPFSVMWDQAPLRGLGLSEICHYDDAFTMQEVTQQELDRFNFVSGMVPAVLKLSKDISSKLAPERINTICLTLQELQDFMIVNGEADDDRQKLLRNLQIVDLLKDIIQKIDLSRSHPNDTDDMVKIIENIYNVMQCYLMGDSRMNELYVAKHLNFFIDQTKLRHTSAQKISKSAMSMITELLRDNRQIIDNITTLQIDDFISYLQTNKDYRYLQLLGTLCVCDGTTLRDNQNYIINKWLKAQPLTAVYLMQTDAITTETGEHINIKLLMNGGKGELLHDFLSKRSSKALVEKNVPQLSCQEERLFLENQLDLFSKLCAGRNEVTLDLLTNSREFCSMFSWDVMFAIISDETVPDNLRAQYCHLLIALYLDVGDNRAVTDHTVLTYHYRPERSGGDDLPEEPVYIAGMDKLKTWIHEFLEHNHSMAANQPQTNKLIEQVIRLLGHLVRFGYYSTELRSVVEPLTKLLDGRTDVPFEKDRKQDCPNGKYDAYQNYRNKERFSCSPEAKVIVDVKLGALDVIELILKWQLDKHLHNFVMTTFRVNHNFKTDKSKKYERSKVLFKLFSQSFRPDNNKQTTIFAKKALETIMSDDVLDIPELTDILLDLTEYQYNKLVCKSLHLLNKLYCTRHDLITAAQKTRLLISKESVKVNAIVSSSYITLRRLVKSKIGKQESTEVVKIMQQLTGFCIMENSEDEINRINQKIIMNLDNAVDQSHGPLSSLELLSEGLTAMVHRIEEKESLNLLLKKGIPEVIAEFLKQSYKAKNLADSGLVEVTASTLLLYKFLIKGNTLMQDEAFDSMDSLLGVHGMEGIVAQVLIQVFTNNHRLCMMIKAEQIQCIVKLVAQKGKKAPELLHLLASLVKDEKLSVPLKKNQNMVMKYVMENYNKVCSILINTEMNSSKCDSSANYMKKRRPTGIRQNEEEEDEKLIYLISIVDLLATCAEGENSFIESICQTILPIQQVFSVLSSDVYGHNVKRPFLRFLLWTYLNTAGGTTMEALRNLAVKLTSRVLDDLSSVLSDTAMSCTQQSSERPKGKVETAEELENILNITEHCLLQPVDKSVLCKTEEEAHSCNLHYIFDAVLPFVSLWLSHTQVYTVEVRNTDLKHIKYPALLDKLLIFAEVITKANVICKIQQVDCLKKAVVTAVSFAQVNCLKNAENFHERYEELVFQEKPVKTVVSYQEAYAEELTDNKIFDIFCDNYMKAYRGQNTVTEQLGPQKGVLVNKWYTEVDKGIELPLGEEFQKLVQCYSANNFQKAQKLMEQLSFSSTHLSTEEQNHPCQVELDVKCLQILRAFIHNQERKIPEKGDTERYKQMVKDIQNKLIEMNVLGLTLSIPERRHCGVVKEYFAFANDMLLFANTNSQEAFKEIFYGTREEAFFFTVKDRISKSVSLTKERRSLAVQFVTSTQKVKSQEQALKSEQTGSDVNEDEAFEDDSDDDEDDFGAPLDNKMTAVKMRRVLHADDVFVSPEFVPRKTSNVRMSLVAGYGVKAELQMKSISSVLSEEDDADITVAEEDQNNNISYASTSASKARIKKKVRIICEDDRQPQALELSKFKDEGSVELMLNLLAKLCDGQYKDMQDYLRDQFDNYKSANLVADTTSFLSLLYTHIDNTNIDLVIQIFTTLNEMVSGNYENYFVVWENGVSEYVNYILRTNSYENCNKLQIHSLWLAISNLLLSILEEATSKSDDSLADIKGFVDVKSIEKITVACYKDAHNKQGHHRKESADLTELALKVGFNYFFILQRFRNIEEYHVITGDDDKDDRDVDKDYQMDEALAEHMYDKETKCIEILKDGHLHKIWFRVKDESLLEDKLKEEVKWNIDRTSATDKLRDLTEWTDEIIDDLNHKKKVKNWHLGLVISYWRFCLNLCFALSFIISILTLVFWKAKVSLADIRNNTLTLQIYDPAPVYSSPIYKHLLHIFGSIHSLASGVILIGYWTSKRVEIIDVSLKDSLRNMMRTLGLYKSEVKKKKSKAQFRLYFFSLKTLYYIAFPVFSVLGHFYHGYFFAFHLLVIVHTSQILKGVILAITKHSMQLLLVTFLGVILLYQFSLIAFATFRFAMDPTREDTPMFCSTLGKCFVTIVRYGLIGELFEKMSVHESDQSFDSWGKLVSYHIFFFVIITTIGLNLIFGIILDTFSELRSQQSEAVKDMKSTCFICSRSAHEFESYTKGGFKHHVLKEHNMWDYIFFFMYLNETEFTDYTCLELYVYKMKQENKLDYFPINKAMSLQGQECSESDEKIDQILAMITAVMDRYDKEKADRERENERLKQQRWEEQNRIQDGTPRRVPANMYTPGGVYSTPSTTL